MRSLRPSDRRAGPLLALPCIVVGGWTLMQSHGLTYAADAPGEGARMRLTYLLAYTSEGSNGGAK